MKRGDILLTTLISIVLAIMLSFTFMNFFTSGCEAMTVRSKDSLKALAVTLETMPEGTQSLTYDIDFGAAVIIFPNETQKVRSAIGSTSVVRGGSAAGPGGVEYSIVPVLGDFSRPSNCPKDKACVCLTTQYLDQSFSDVLDNSYTDPSLQDSKIVPFDNKYTCYETDARFANPQNQTYVHYRAKESEMRDPIFYATKQKNSHNSIQIYLCQSEPNCWQSIKMPATLTQYNTGSTIYVFDQGTINTETLRPEVPENYDQIIPYTRTKYIVIETFSSVFGQSSYEIEQIVEEFREVQVQSDIRGLQGALARTWIARSTQRQVIQANHFEQEIRIAKQRTGVTVVETGNQAG